MVKKILLTALAATAFAGAVAVTGLAVLNSQATVGSNTFTTGSVSIVTDHPSTAIVSFNAMMPGDSVGPNPLIVTNDGGASLRYAVSSVATNTDTKGLKDALTLTIKTIDATTPASPCNDFDGTQLYSGDLDSAAGKLIGDNTQGNNTGDRTLASGVSETLCFKVSFSSSASGPTGAATTATFTFDAEQTSSNP